MSENKLSATIKTSKGDININLFADKTLESVIVLNKLDLPTLV